MRARWSIAVLILVLAAGGCVRRGAGADAQTLLARGDYAGAERAADRQLAGAPDDAALWRLKMDAVMRQGDHQRAVVLYLAWHRKLRHYDPRAIRVLAVAVVREAARDPDPAVRARAVSMAAHLAPELGEVARTALADPNPWVRVAAARAVGGDRGRTVARALLSDPAVRIRAAAVAVVGRDDRAAAMAALADPSPRVRGAAVRASSKRRAATVRRRLLALATSDPDGSVRADALRTLDPGTVASVDAALRALDDDYLGARLAAIFILERDTERGIPALRAAVTSPEPYTALRAAVALGKANVAVGSDVVDRAMADRRWNVRAAGLNAVARIAPRADAIRIARRSLVDDNLEVRMAAARALARLGETGKAAAAYQAALSAPDDDARLQAALGLLLLGDDSAIDALTKLLSSPDPATRAAAATSLGRSSEVPLALIRALADPDTTVRLAAAAAIGGPYRGRNAWN